MSERINKPNKTQEARILDALTYTKEHNNGWVNGQYFLRTMLISQYYRAIHNLEQRDKVSIEHSQFKDEFGFLSYRLSPGGQTESRAAHNREIAGSTPAPATKPAQLSKEWVFESKTQPGKKHHVIDFTTCYVCDCIGYSYRKTCGHIETVKKLQVAKNQ